MNLRLLLGPAVFAVAAAAPFINARDQADRELVAALDTEYQAAVEQNDWQRMDRILHPEFTLVLGNGTVYSRADLIASARDEVIVYEKQVEIAGTQTVRLFGKDTATVTALLWLKGRRSKDNSDFDYKLWFSDTYVRTAEGWKYAFGQASTRL